MAPPEWLDKLLGRTREPSIIIISKNSQGIYHFEMLGKTYEENNLMKVAEIIARKNTYGVYMTRSGFRVGKECLSADDIVVIMNTYAKKHPDRQFALGKDLSFFLNSSKNPKNAKVENLENI